MNGNIMTLKTSSAEVYLLVKSLPNFREAIKHCIWKADLSQSRIADILCIAETQLSMFLSATGDEKGDVRFPEKKLPKLMEICGNQIPLQWLAHHSSYSLVEMKEFLDEQLAERLKEKDLEIEKVRKEKEQLQQELKTMQKIMDVFSKNIGEKLIK